MKNIFSKNDFPKALGGDLYEWKDAETTFSISKTGLYVIKISASAKNAQQNDSTDDDDLRIALDDFHFGKYEINQAGVSWKGFGTAASWNGASLKGGEKTTYFFIELDKKEHKIQFFADGRPEIKNLEIFEIEDLHFELKDLIPTDKIEAHLKGIPWLGFIFLGSNPKMFSIDVNVKSAKQKGTTDGDNLKIIVNGKILKNPRTPSSKKYGNFYFSGDVKWPGVLTLGNENLSSPLSFENSIELWYDKEPGISNVKINFFDTENFLNSIKDSVDLREYIVNRAWWAILFFQMANRTYSSKFLKHSLIDNPEPLIFKSNHPLIRKIKADFVYSKIVEKIKERISDGNLEGEIWPEDFRSDPVMNGKINFDSDDLATAIHGIRKIEFKANQVGDFFDVKIMLFDIYDFAASDTPFSIFHPIEDLKGEILKALDMGEDLKVINNFEVQIHISSKISLI